MDFKNVGNEISKSEFENLFEDEFFVIESDKLQDVRNKLYGFLLTENGVINNQNEIPLHLLNGDGTYVYVNVNDQNISIFQDYNGCYGLYLYQNENYFAISNSFLKLVEHLKSTENLTLNWDFGKLLLAEGLASHIYKETLINEIMLIPRNYTIHIDKIKKTFEFEEKDYKHWSVDLNSVEALDILDNWYNKWVNIIRSIKQKTNNMIIDLSGGFDSRTAFIFALSSNIDLNKVKIASINTDSNDYHKEDYEIATDIANECNFKLNQKVFPMEQIPFKDMSTSLMMTSYSQLGVHNQASYFFYRYKEPIFSFTGGYGENLRGYNQRRPNELLDYYEIRCRRLDNTLIEPAKRILNASFNRIQDEYSIEEDNSKEITDLLYTESWNRNHFGRLYVQRYLTNLYKLAPLSDAELVKLRLKTDECEDEQLLIAIILSRYCPELLNFRFDRERKFDEATLEMARKINTLKPFVQENGDVVSGPEINQEEIDKIPDFEYVFGHGTLNKYIKDIFYSRLFEMEFKKYFPTNLYNQISRSIETRTYFPVQDAIPAIEILKLINDINLNPLKQEYNMASWINALTETDIEIDDSIHPLYVEKIFDYVSARIDVINRGVESNNIEIIENSDVHSNVQYPEWFKSEEGQGLSLVSKKTFIDLKLKCINDGELQIKFRSRDVRDKNRKRYPIYIDGIKLVVDNDEIFSGHNVMSHDKPIIFRKDVKNNDVIDIHFEWKPFNKSCEYPN